jgi:hypothetical protein
MRASRGWLSGVLGAGALIVTATTAWAQTGPGVDVIVPAPRPPDAAAEPGLGLQPALPATPDGAPRPEDHGAAFRGRHEPVFVTPFLASVPVSRTSAVRLGLSGWTAPALPGDIVSATGGLGFGLTFQWGVPIPGVEAPPPAPVDR